MAKEFKFKEAVGEYDFIIENGVDLPPDFHVQRGYFKFRALDFEGCIADCTFALTSKPELQNALYNRAAAYKETEREDLALADLNSLLSINPRHELGSYLRALLYGSIGQWERSLSAWNAYIELKPQDWWPRLYRGIALAEMGRKREAINEYLIGSGLNPKFKSFYFRRWLLYRELNETELAQRDLEAGNAILDEPDELRPRDPRDPAVARADEKIRKLMEESRSEK